MGQGPVPGTAAGRSCGLGTAAVEGPWLCGPGSYVQQLGMAAGLAPCQDGKMCSTAAGCPWPDFGRDGLEAVLSSGVGL